MRIKTLLLGIMFFLFCLTTPIYVQCAELDDVLTISSSAEFLEFAENCRLDSYSAGLTVKLDADIDLTGQDFSGIPIFSGTFEGNHHSISGINLNRSGTATGLFRYLTEVAVVRDLNLSGSITPGGSSDTVGTVAGNNCGKIQGCIFSGTVIGSNIVGGITGYNAATGIVTDCSVEGSVTGNHFVGGIAGNNDGVIQKCQSIAQINTEPESMSVALSDITIETLAGTENANAITDVGGISGANNGSVTQCQNNGAVGYPSIGYNIGGIVGTSSGYVFDCTNHGSISGRKDVGGIAGQLEPTVLISYSTDTLQILSGQLDTLSTLTTNASAHLNDSFLAIKEQFTLIRGQILKAQDALTSLTPSFENNQFHPNAQQISDAITTLHNALSTITNSLRTIEQQTENAGAVFQNDLQSINNMVAQIQQTVKSGENHVGGSVSDVSEQDTPSDLTSKIQACDNHADIYCDINAGGIVGSIGIESDLDPEADLDILGDYSLNFLGSYRAVVTQCQNNASVTVKKLNAGGITGLASLGAIQHCNSSGELACPKASYVGGIAGYSRGSIRSCNVKSQLSAQDHVGGIAGFGSTVSDCNSIVQITAEQITGCILGQAKDLSQVSNNLYLPAPTDHGAIDGISYHTLAQAAELADFLALDDLPSFFSSSTVTFVLPDNAQQELDVPLGQPLQAEHIPVFKTQSGNAPIWNLPDGPVFFDTVIYAVQTNTVDVLQSSQTRQNSLPILLAHGEFNENDLLLIQQPEQTPIQNAIECWDLSVKGTVTTLRYLPPETVNSNDVTVMLKNADGQWYTSNTTQEGQYVVIPVNNHISALCAVYTPHADYTAAILAGCGIMLVAVILTVAIIKSKKKPVSTTVESAE